MPAPWSDTAGLQTSAVSRPRSLSTPVSRVPMVSEAALGLVLILALLI